MACSLSALNSATYVSDVSREFVHLHGAEMRLTSIAVVLVQAALPGTLAVRTMIPSTSFDSQADFNQSWAYNYPWGTDHNGGARMDPSHVVIDNGTVTLTAVKVSGQKPASQGGKTIPINYLSGTIYAKDHFNVSVGGGYDFSGEFKATTTKGTWPAFVRHAHSR